MSFSCSALCLLRQLGVARRRTPGSRTGSPGEMNHAEPGAYREACFLPSSPRTGAMLALKHATQPQETPQGSLNSAIVSQTCHHEFGTRTERSPQKGAVLEAMPRQSSSSTVVAQNAALGSADDSKEGRVRRWSTFIKPQKARRTTSKGLFSPNSVDKDTAKPPAGESVASSPVSKKGHEVGDAAESDWMGRMKGLVGGKKEKERVLEESLSRERQAHEQAVAALRAELSEAKADATRLRGEAEAKDARIRSLNEKYQEFSSSTQDSIAEKDTTIDELSVRISELESDIMARDDQLQSLDDEHKASTSTLTTTVTHLKREVSQLTDTLKATTSEVQAKDQIITSLSAEHQKLSRSLKGTISQKDESLADIERQLAASLADTQRLDQEVASLTASSNEHIALSVSLSETLAQRDETIGRLSETLAEREVELDAKDGQVYSLSLTAKEHEELEQELRSTISQNEQSIIDLTNLLEEKEAAVELREAESRGLFEAKEQSEELCAMLKEMVTRHEATIAELNGRLAEREGEGEFKEQEILSLTKDHEQIIAEKEDLIAQLNESLREKEVEVRAKDLEVTSLNESNTDSKTTLAAREKSIIEHAKTITALKDRLADRDKRIKDLTSALSTAPSRNSSSPGPGRQVNGTTYYTPAVVRPANDWTPPTAYPQNPTPDPVWGNGVSTVDQSANQTWPYGTASVYNQPATTGYSTWSNTPALGAAAAPAPYGSAGWSTPPPPQTTAPLNGTYYGWSTPPASPPLPATTRRYSGPQPVADMNGVNGMANGVPGTSRRRPMGGYNGNRYSRMIPDTTDVSGNMGYGTAEVAR
ncbi:hypothetical protein FA13DRAFT_1707965 [Coprinellus micaceus]|uniref:Uncharacterized protein n=1 Tax=Coprinellus micaceus TaxID=71717 RepID=A0A4Y7THU4_COPMI|nr:hypothetical protein FA13DRAFT_1707965 [Coprinellus micaceus]